MRAIAAVAALMLALLAAGCGDSESSDVTSVGSTQAKKPASEPLYEREMGPEGREWLRTAAAASAGKGRDPRWSELEKTAEPVADRLVLPHGPPPKEVVFKDLRVGKGPTLEPGDYFGAVYASFDYKSGAMDQEVTDGSTSLYAYGVGELVKGWEPGLRGMRAGGIRELVVPSNWAYRTGALVYVVKLLRVEKEE